MKSSAHFYTDEVILERESFFQSHKATDNTTNLLVKKAFGRLNRIKDGRLLDIGTGNGFVLTEVYKSLINIDGKELYGIDLSEQMVKKAKELTHQIRQIKIVQGDNYSLPFDDNYFDVVTNKLSTNFSFAEVFRVLKKGGLFIFKEYGLLKGFGGISESFNTRMKIVDPLHYLELLRNEKPQIFSYQQYFFKKIYTKEEVVNIFSMAPIIRDFKAMADMPTIDNLFKNNEIRVVSDPFIITAKK